MITDQTIFWIATTVFAIVTEIVYIFMIKQEGDIDGWWFHKIIAILAGLLGVALIVVLPLALEKDYPGTWYYPLVAYITIPLVFISNYYIGKKITGA